MLVEQSLVNRAQANDQPKSSIQPDVKLCLWNESRAEFRNKKLQTHFLRPRSLLLNRKTRIRRCGDLTDLTARTMLA